MGSDQAPAAGDRRAAGGAGVPARRGHGEAPRSGRHGAARRPGARPAAGAGANCASGEERHPDSAGAGAHRFAGEAGVGGRQGNADSRLERGVAEEARACRGVARLRGASPQGPRQCAALLPARVRPVPGPQLGDHDSYSAGHHATMTSPRDGVLVTARARTDLGRTRDHNEDAFLVADLTTRTTDLTNGGPHRVGERGSLFLVADGMGGAAAGELASSMAADLIFRHLVESWDSEPNPSPDQFVLHLKAALVRANERIHLYSTEHPDVRGMGTTATVAGVLGGALYLAQVGDSRAYLVRDGTATQLTKDQSLMQRLVDAGELTEEEAEQSERRNIILQALGPDAKIRVDLTWQELRRGDTLVICSDGLSGQVKREEIAQLVKESPDLDALCDHLIVLANERGGPDNITTVVARFDGEGLATPDTGADVAYRAYPTNDPDSDEHDIVVPVAPRPPEPGPASPPAPPPPAPPAPPAPVVAEPPPAHPVRSGSPVTMTLAGAALLLLLLLLYLLLRH
ncbi:MAG: hypothetical protein DMD43_07235 [Gemmatimonadetes bacterium]|nr:MAG: hypothetical protein DMD43_07235 [Gemmatimonadota bacterium]